MSLRLYARLEGAGGWERLLFLDLYCLCILFHFPTERRLFLNTLCSSVEGRVQSEDLGLLLLFLNPPVTSREATDVRKR